VRGYGYSYCFTFWFRRDNPPRPAPKDVSDRGNRCASEVETGFQYLGTLGVVKTFHRDLYARDSHCNLHPCRGSIHIHPRGCCVSRRVVCAATL
jgi:hypothetical protein